MKKIFKFFTERHLLANIFTVMILIVGITTLFKINKDLFPRVKLNEVIITTVYPGASPEDVEQNITNKIESEIKGVDGIEKYTSQSVEDISLITVRIDDDLKESKVNLVVQEIREAVSRVTDLPKEVEERPFIQRVNSNLYPVLGVGLTTENTDYKELREYSKILQKKIKELPDIAKAELTGYKERQVKIEVNPEMLNFYNMPVTEVIDAVSGKNIRETAGTIDSYDNEKNVVTTSLFENPQEVNDVIIRNPLQSKPIRVKDIGKVIDGYVDDYVKVRINGKEVIYFDIKKKENSNIIKTVNSIKKLLKDEIEYIPAGSHVLFTNDLSRYVKSSFNVVLTNGISGFILVMIILTLFLSFRVSFWVAMGIPISILGTIILLPFFNIHLDVVTLAAMILIIGMIVDDAIIISERIYYYREKGETPVNSAVKGLQDVFWPVVTTIISTLLAFMPMFLIKGDIGKFIRVIPLTISIALTISLLESVIALPSHISHGFKKQKNKIKKINKREEFFKKIQNLYTRLLKKILPYRYILCTVFILILIGSITYAVFFMKIEVFPTKGAEEFALHIETPVGTSVEKTSLKIKEIENIIDKLPKKEVDSYITLIGNQEGALIQGHIATIRVNLKPYSKRKRNADQIADEIRKSTNQLKGYTKIFYDIADSGPNPEMPISIKIAGNNNETRNKLADDIVTYLKENDNILDLDSNNKKGKKTVSIIQDHEKLTKLGFNESIVAYFLRIILNGKKITKVQYSNENVKFRLIYPKTIRKNENKILDIKIPNINNRLIPIREFAETKTIDGLSNFYHFNGERAVTISARTKNDAVSPEKIIEDIKANFNLKKDYPGTRFIVEGSIKKKKESMKNITRTFIIALIGIYFLLVLLFNSLKQPLLVLAAIPFGISGVIITFALHGEPISFMALLGTVGLTGVVVNDSLVMVDFLNKIDKKEESSFIECIAKGAGERLRAVILTTITTAAGLLPLAYGIGGSDPITAPMALALGWGLVLATPLTLILIPSLYMINNDIEKLINKLKLKKTAKSLIGV